MAVVVVWWWDDGLHNPLIAQPTHLFIDLIMTLWVIMCWSSAGPRGADCMSAVLAINWSLRAMNMPIDWDKLRRGKVLLSFLSQDLCFVSSCCVLCSCIETPCLTFPLGLPVSRDVLAMIEVDGMDYDDNAQVSRSTSVLQMTDKMMSNWWLMTGHWPMITDDWLQGWLVMAGDWGLLIGDWWLLQQHVPMLWGGGCVSGSKYALIACVVDTSQDHEPYSARV